MSATNSTSATTTCFRTEGATRLPTYAGRESTKERQPFIQARLSQLTECVTKLANNDIGKIPAGRVGFRSRVVVVDDVTEVQETYHFVYGDAGEQWTSFSARPQM